MNSQQSRGQKTQNNQYSKDTTNKKPGADVRTDNPNITQQKEAGDRLHAHDNFSSASSRTESYGEDTASGRPVNNISADDPRLAGKGKNSSSD